VSPLVLRPALCLRQGRVPGDRAAPGSAAGGTPVRPGSRLRDGVRTGSRAADTWHLSAPRSWPTGWVGSSGLQAAELGRLCGHGTAHAAAGEVFPGPTRKSNHGVNRGFTEHALKFVYLYLFYQMRIAE